MAIFKRHRDEAADGGRPDLEDALDTPEALRAAVVAQVRAVNRAAGQLPTPAVITARELTDTLDDIIDTSNTRPLDVYAVITLRNTLEDYLPTTLQTFLAVPEAARAVRRPSGGTPEHSLLEQLEALLEAATAVLEGAQRQDVDALMTQGAFLTTKFGRTDLAL